MSSRAASQVLTIAASVMLSVAATLAATMLVYEPAANAGAAASHDDDRVEAELERMRARIAELEDTLAAKPTKTSFDWKDAEKKPSSDADLAALQARVASLERGSAEAASATGDAPADVEAVVEELLNARELAELEAKRLAQQAKLAETRDKVLEASIKRLQGFAEQLGLADWQLAEIEAMASELTMDYLIAQADGASKEELDAIVRDANRETQRIMGDAMYRDYRVARYNSEVDPKIDWVMGAVSGDEQQRERMREHWYGHSDRTVDRRIRVDTQEMTPEEREELRRELEEADGEAWREGVETVLTPEQQRQMEGWGK